MNTHPNTPFGKFFFKIGIWQPTVEETIEYVYEKLVHAEKVAVIEASGWIAIINANLDQTPDFVFDLIQQKFPNVSKDNVATAINKLNAAIIKIDDNVADDIHTAISRLQAYLSQYEGQVWASISQAAAAVLATILTDGKTPIQKIWLVLEYVYQTFIKGKIIV